MTEKKDEKEVDFGAPLPVWAEKYDTGTCDHCGEKLTESEVRRARGTWRVHGFGYWCKACSDAWGEMTFGWQAGVPANRKVAFADRGKKWDARKKK